MNKIIHLFLSVFFSLFIYSVYGEEFTVNIPIVEDADIFSRNDQKNVNFGDKTTVNPLSWTWDSDRLGQGTFRSLLKPSLADLPAYQKIIKVELYLYHTDGGWAGHPYSNQNISLSGRNSARIYPVSSAWEENNVTWNTQPGISNNLSATIPASTSKTQDYIIDVTELFINLLNSPDNFGWMIMLDHESPYRQLIFASSENSNPAIRPMLKMTYSANCKEITTKLYSTADANIFSRNDQVNINYGTQPTISPLAWTWNTDNLDEGYMRSYINFEFNEIPANADILSANLHLFHASTGGFAGPPYSNYHTSLNGKNAASIYKVSSEWDESTITWNNKPGFDNHVSALIPESQNSTQDYTINVINLFTGNNPYGWMIKFDDEDPYKQLLFGSREHTDIAKHPYIEVTYSSCLILNTDNQIFTNTKDLTVFPNPSNTIFHIDLNTNEKIKSIEILNLSGEVILIREGNSSQINAETLKPGTYLLKVAGEHTILTQKIIKH